MIVSGSTELVAGGYGFYKAGAGGASYFMNAASAEQFIIPTLYTAGEFTLYQYELNQNLEKISGGSGR